MVAYHDSDGRTATTIRSTKCSYLVSEHGRCSACHPVQVYSSCNVAQPVAADKSDPSSTTNLRCLTTPQKLARFRQLCLDFKCNYSQVERLRLKLTASTEERSTEVDEGLNRNLVAIVEEASPQISDMYHPGSFQRVFWEQQRKSNSLKYTRGMRWDTLMIWWCLYLRHLSERAYDLLRDAGVNILPSQRTLRDYTYTLYVRLAHAVSPTNTNFWLTFLLT